LLKERRGLAYTTVRFLERRIVTLKVGIREFRDKLASYLLEAAEPVVITLHGDIVGYYVPSGGSAQ